MEYIIVNETEYACQSITTGLDKISFVMEGKELSDIKTIFEDVTSLEVAGEDKTVYGIYKNLYFESATVYADDSINVTMAIKSNIEVRLENLERIQAEQDEAIAELKMGN